MENMEFRITRTGKLIIEIDLNYRGEVTKSEKSEVVATSEGNLDLWRNGQPTGIKLNLSCYKPLSRGEQYARHRRKFLPQVD